MEILEDKVESVVYEREWVQDKEGNTINASCEGPEFIQKNQHDNSIEEEAKPKSDIDIPLCPPSNIK